MAEEDAYVQRERPDERADLVIDGGRDLWRWPMHRRSAQLADSSLV